MPKRTKGCLAVAVSLVVMLGTSALSASSASAISSDYCGYPRVAGEPFCFEGSGYRGWRYHQASTGGPLLPDICTRAWTGNNYRTGSGCAPYASLRAFQYCSADPIANSSVGWFGGGGSVTLYGHADSRTCGSVASGETSGGLPSYIRDRFEELSAAGTVKADPANAVVVASQANAALFEVGGAVDRCAVRVSKAGWSTACRPSDADVPDDQLNVEHVEPSGYRVYGLVGDDALEAQLSLQTGEEIVAPVSEDGGLLIETLRQPKSVTVLRSDGSRSTTALHLD